MARAHDTSEAQIAFQVADGEHDSLLVSRYRGTEGLSRLYRYEIELVCEDAGVAFDEIVGKPAVLTFVVDVSGSMKREDRLELVKDALFLLLDQMDPDDQVGIVVYSNSARVVLRHTSLRDRRRIERVIMALEPRHGTNAEAGLVEGYKLADEAYRRGYINRVILCSDGVANIGRTGAESILERIKSADYDVTEKQILGDDVQQPGTYATVTKKITIYGKYVPGVGYEYRDTVKVSEDVVQTERVS